MSGMLMGRVAELIASGAALGAGEKLVLFALAHYATKDGIFPSLDTISRLAGMDRRSVIRCLARLTASGRVTVEYGGGRGRSNRYELHLEPAVPPPGETGAQSHPLTHVNGDTESPFAASKTVTQSPPLTPNRDSAPPFKVLNSDSESPDLRSKKKDSEANASDAEAASPPPSSRDLVWSQGVPLVRHLTGKTDAQCRSMLGRMLRDVRDDCPRLLMVLQQARDFQPIDPVAWLTAATKPKSVKAGRDERILRAAGLWEEDTTFDFDHEPRGMLQ